ncbi:MAG: NifU N-terminal domain-containing protein [Acidimicrobiia bacterium]|nr:NifU N-terminal domain-containing protein [Acidimicrobiia bacterium]
MGITVETTPNPRALKFTLEEPVGGPATYTDAATADERVAPILQMDGVTSVFMTANFITVTRSEAATWDGLTAQIVAALTKSFEPSTPEV